MKRDLKICLQALFKIHITCIFVKKRIMTTLTLKFQLDESLAIAYRQAQPEEKEDLKKLFQRLLTNKFRKQSVEDMLQRIDEIGKEAESNGLTEDIIDEILAKSPPKRPSNFGSAIGLITMSDNFNEPLDEFQEYM